MPVVYPNRRSKLPLLALIALLLMASGIVAFALLRNGSAAAVSSRQVIAEPMPSPAAQAAEAMPSSPALAASGATAAVQVPGSLNRSVKQWQASVQPQVVAAIRTDSLVSYQVQMDRWSCEGQQCVGSLRIPPTVEAGQKGDMRAASNIFDTLKTEMAKSSVDVAIQSIQPGPQGLAASFQFTPNQVAAARTLTDADLAAIRLESYQQGNKEHVSETSH